MSALTRSVNVSFIHARFLCASQGARVAAYGGVRIWPKQNSLRKDKCYA